MEKALGKKSTDELAVMWDTFRPLKLSSLWAEIDQPEYALSWNPDRSPEPASVDGAKPESESVVTGPSA